MRMLTQPRGQSRGLAVGQHVNAAVGDRVDEQGRVPATARRKAKSSTLNAAGAGSFVIGRPMSTRTVVRDTFTPNRASTAAPARRATVTARAAMTRDRARLRVCQTHRRGVGAS